MGRRKLTKQFYGSVCIPRIYCKDCGGSAFVVDKKFTCCGATYLDNAEKEESIRIVDSENRRSAIPLKLKKKVLEAQDNKCIYCNKELNTHVYNYKTNKRRLLKVHYDHWVPWCYDGDNNLNNIYASCNICNGIKSSKHFHDLISAREYINEKREKKGYM